MKKLRVVVAAVGVVALSSIAYRGLLPADSRVPVDAGTADPDAAADPGSLNEPDRPPPTGPWSRRELPQNLRARTQRLDDEKRAELIRLLTRLAPNWRYHEEAVEEMIAIGGDRAMDYLLSIILDSTIDPGAADLAWFLIRNAEAAGGLEPLVELTRSGKLIQMPPSLSEDVRNAFKHILTGLEYPTRIRANCATELAHGQFDAEMAEIALELLNPVQPPELIVSAANLATAQSMKGREGAAFQERVEDRLLAVLPVLSPARRQFVILDLTVLQVSPERFSMEAEYWRADNREARRLALAGMQTQVGKGDPRNFTAVGMQIYYEESDPELRAEALELIATAQRARPDGATVAWMAGEFFGPLQEREKADILDTIAGLGFRNPAYRDFAIEFLTHALEDQATSSRLKAEVETCLETMGNR